MEGIRVPAHPLDTPLIVECILKNLGVPDLKTCRQVNSLWHKAATKCMRAKVSVTFTSTRKSVPIDGIQNFLEIVQSELSTFSSLPFAFNYTLWDVRVDRPEFWAFCGSSMKTLNLSLIEFDSTDALRHVIFQSCPNLESLDMEDIKVANPENEEGPIKPLVWVEPAFPQNANLKRFTIEIHQLGSLSFLELFSYFPSLEEVHAYDAKATSRIPQSLATCREHDPQSWNIKKITFEMEHLQEPESDLRFLLDGSLSLETLEVFEVEKPAHIKVLRNIISAHATTLKYLRLEGEKAAEILDSPYKTVLEKVVNFSLRLTSITSLRFLQKFPNLKRLELECWFPLPVESYEERSNHWILSSCTELTVHTRVSVGFLSLLRKIPKVEKLLIRGCTNEVFAGICEILPNLVCLELEHSFMDDCGISGLDEEYVARINEDGNLDRRSVTVPRPNLSSLKSLKWFRYTTLFPEANTIGFCAALCGVQELSQLQHLKVEDCAGPIWDRLHDQFPWKKPPTSSLRVC